MRFQRALVTGASSGIGAAMCHFLAAKGIPLIITGRNTDALNQLAETLRQQVDVVAYAYDLSLPKDRQSLFKHIHEMSPDLIINNAGFGLYGEALSHTTEAQSDILEVNGQAVLEIALESARTLVSLNRPGVILNVSSSAAFLPFPMFSVYAASKAFVNSFSIAFDEEMKPYGVRILSACPGVISTNFRHRAVAGKPVEKEGKKAYRTMSVDFAVEQMWKQIQQGSQVRTFNWFYRLSIFFARFLVPRPLLMKILRQQVEALHAPRPLIKIPKEK
jgi:short-subunit dehydrogenase